MDIDYEKGSQFLSVHLLSRKLPHPMTVAVCPAYNLFPVGRHIGLMFFEKVTGESSVNMAMSLYWNRKIQLMVHSK